MPQVAGGPKGLNNLLESAYSACIAGGGTETSCSRQAWGAAKAAGWKKDTDGKWVKKKSVEKRLDELEGETEERFRQMDCEIQSIETQLSNNAEETLWRGVI